MNRLSIAMAADSIYHKATEIERVLGRLSSLQLESSGSTLICHQFFLLRLIAAQLQVFDSENEWSKNDFCSSLPLFSKLASLYRALERVADAIARETVKLTVDDCEGFRPDHKLLPRLSSAVQTMHAEVNEMHGLVRIKILNSVVITHVFVSLSQRVFKQQQC